MDPTDWIDQELTHLAGIDCLRELPAPLEATGPLVTANGRQLINFASNDYLGLAADQRLSEAAIASFRAHGVGRGASPLVSGRSVKHAELEQALARFLGTEAALMFPTSFAANAGTIPALVGEGDAIYGDEKNHASIIDGCRLARAQRHIYPHGDHQSLAQLLAEGSHYRRRLIVTDSLFSMDGDLAPLTEIGRLAREYNAMLMVDEAHAIGVFGAHGRGAIEHFAAEVPALLDAVTLRVGSFGKALGAAGGFVCGSRSLVRWLANRARSFVFSTAHPAAISAAGLRAVELVEQEPQRGAELLARAERLRAQLQALGWNTAGSVSQIIPVIIGSAAETMATSTRLRDHGIWAPGIRPPSVPEGSSLLRLGLTARHTEEMLEKLLAALGPAR